MNYWVKVSIATLVAAGLIGGYFLDEKLSEKKVDAEKVEARALNFEAAKVRKILLSNESGKLSFARDNAASQWVMAEPMGKAKADQDAVSGLVTSLETLNSSLELADTEKVIAGGGDKASFGLDKPRITVEVVLDDGATKKIEVGSDMNIGTKTGSKFEAVSVYGSSSERKLVLVYSSSSLTPFKKSFADLRSKVAGDFKSADVKEFTLIKTTGERIHGVKGDKDWNLTEPRALLADGNNINQFLNTLSGLRVDKVTEKEMLTPANKSMFGLDKPEATIEIKGADGKILQTVLLSKVKDGNYITMADGALGSFATDKWKDINPELKFFRDRRVLRDVAVGEINRIRTESGKVFNKEGAAWYPAEVAALPKSTPDPKATVSGTPTPAGKTSSSDASALFSDWEFLTADDVLDGPEGKNLSLFGLDKPTTRFSLEFSDAKKTPEVILVGNKVPKNEKMVYVKRASRDAVFVVESNWLSNLNKLDGKAEAVKK